MKFYLLIIIFALFVFVGIYIYCRYYFRNKLFKDMGYVIRYLKNSIAFRKDKINILLSEAYNGIAQSSRNLLKNIKNSNSVIYRKEDIFNIQKFLDSIGKGDVDYELNNLSYYENVFDEIKCSSKELLEKNGVMYIKLMIGLGAAICVMLI